MDKQQAKILIVDNDPTNLNVLLDYLHHLGYKVLIAPDGEQALRQVEHILPDLILLDVMMPGIDGFETCRRLKAQELTRDIPVIFMTALSDTEDKLKGFDVGGVDYITKPFQHKEVSVRVKTHLMLRQLQQKLQQQNTHLQAANASKDTFFSIIAHDLRGPLGALRELPEIILERVESYSREELTQMIMAQRDAAKHVFDLLDNLLTWTRIQRGQIEYCPQMMNLAPLVTQNIDLLLPSAQRKHITLTSAVAGHLQVHADYHMTNTVIRNIIFNAIKFTEEYGEITVASASRESLVEVSIMDTGIGIAAEHLPKLFRIDAKFKRSGTAHEKGTGLGLILCKEFVEQQGGRIWMESEVDKGTTVRFTLPTHKPSSQG